MPDFFGEFRLALTLAKREMREGFRGFGIFLVSLALGVGTVAGVGLLSASFESGLRQNARAMLGGDILLRQSHLPVSAQVDEFLESRGEISRTARLRAMAAVGSARTLVELKAVDDAYPLYGELKLDPALNLSEAFALQDGLPGAVAEAGLLRRLGVSVGDRVTLGHAEFRITGVIRGEPDRVAAFFGLGPRMIVHARDLPTTGLIQPGSVIYYTTAVRLPLGRDAGALKEELVSRFPETSGMRIRTSDGGESRVERYLSRMSRNLLLIGLACLLIGGIGIAGAVRNFLSRRTASIAAMKCLGASRRLVHMTYLAQTLFLGLTGTGLGLIVGSVLARSLGAVVAARLGLDFPFRMHALPLLFASAFGLLTTLLFSLLPLSRAGRVSPALLFRGYVAAVTAPPTKKAVCAVAICGMLLAFLLLLQTRDAVLVGLFFVGIGGATLLFALLSRLLVALLRPLRHKGHLVLRHAVGNILRPGSTARTILFSLGLGITVLVVVVMIDASLQEQISRSIPQNAPSFFLLDVPAREIDPLREMALAERGVREFTSQPSIRGRITAINGKPAQEGDVAPGSAWALRSDRAMTFADRQPTGVDLSAGSWWPENYDGPPLLCFDQDLAEGFGIGVGDTLTLSVLGREITATISCLRRIDWTSLELNQTIILTPNVFVGAPFTYLAAVSVDRSNEDAFFAALTKAYPGIVTVHTRDILDDVSAMLANIGRLLRIAALVTVLAGLLVLAQAVRATLRRRHFEAVVFKVLGASRREVLASLAAEFLLLGVLGGLSAAVAGTLLAWLFFAFLMDLPFTFHLLPLSAIVAASGLATILFGLTGVGAALGGSVLSVLRNE